MRLALLNGISIEVAAEAPMTASETSELATNFTPKFTRDAPLFVAGNMRNPESFILLMPGVNGTQDNTSINGCSRRSKEVLLDGAAQTIPESGGVVADFGAVEQFRLLTNNFAAEYGHTGGGIEIFVTNSGTNQLHGTVFDYLRHDKLAAAGWSINSRPGAVKGKIRQNEFRVAVGGPILIPKLYDGRNRGLHTATLLPSGRVLLVGGFEYAYNTALDGRFGLSLLGSAEIF